MITIFGISALRLVVIQAPTACSCFEVLSHRRSTASFPASSHVVPPFSGVFHQLVPCGDMYEVYDAIAILGRI